MKHSYPTRRDEPLSRKLRAVFFAVLAAGTLARILFVAHPTDARTLASWREADYTQVARSFFREGMNPFYPRIDWRGTTPGYVEMELPVVPFTAAAAYHVLGYHEEILRAVSALCGVAALLAFAHLARRLLPPAASVFATAVFAANGLLVALAGSIQPEPLMLLLTILAANAVRSWAESGATGKLFAACALTAAAILTKSPAAYLGLVLAYFVLRYRGRRAFSDLRIWAAAALAILPPLAWYAWAYHHYLGTGLSLGVSNETHFLNLGVLRHPKYVVLGNLVAEGRDVFAVFGVVLAAFAFRRPWARIELAAVWYAAVAVFYVATADTSGDGWAFYYHCSSVPPACLLVGFGFAALTERAGSAARRPRLAAVAGGLLAVLTLAGSVARAVQIGWERDHQPELEEMYRCSHELGAHVPPEGRIVVRGGRRFDGHGHPVAYNESMIFTWMDRKGMNYAMEDYSLETLEEMARRGADYWVAKPADLEDETVRAEVERRWALIARCDGYSLYDLTSTEQRGAGE